MPQILQLAHLVEHHRVPQVNVGSRGVQTQLDTQGLSCCMAARQFAGKLGFDEQFVAAAFDDG